MGANYNVFFCLELKPTKLISVPNLRQYASFEILRVYAAININYDKNVLKDLLKGIKFTVVAKVR